MCFSSRNFLISVKDLPNRQKLYIFYFLFAQFDSFLFLFFIFNNTNEIIECSLNQHTHILKFSQQFWCEWKKKLFSSTCRRTFFGKKNEITTLTFPFLLHFFRIASTLNCAIFPTINFIMKFILFICLKSTLKYVARCQLSQVNWKLTSDSLQQQLYESIKRRHKPSTLSSFISSTLKSFSTKMCYLFLSHTNKCDLTFMLSDYVYSIIIDIKNLVCVHC